MNEPLIEKVLKQNDLDGDLLQNKIVFKTGIGAVQSISWSKWICAQKSTGKGKKQILVFLIVDVFKTTVLWIVTIAVNMVIK